MDEIQTYVADLLSATESDAFLVISIAGSDDFLQLTADAHGAQIDFPLVTDRQQTTEWKIRQTAEAARLPVVENKGSGGERFLDINVDGSAAEVARVCRLLLRDVFGAGEETELEFQNG